MANLKSYQRKYLKGLAHKLKPVVFVGQKGITDSLISAINEALDNHELIKIRFVDYKEKDSKKRVIADIEKVVGCDIVGRIGHILIVFRQHEDPERRKITVPGKEPGKTARRKSNDRRK
jgi:RNA-binding protein